MSYNRYKNDKCGIYIITNTVNGKYIIGRSKHIYCRWVTYKKELGENRYHNQHLQRAWNKYGGKNFIFEILLECPEEKLNEEEIRLIKEYKSDDRNFGYNIEAGGGCFSQSIETRQKISESLKGNKRRLGIKHTEETKKQLSESHKGIKCLESTKDKLSKLKKGVKRSIETCIKIGNASRGRKLSDSAKEKLRIFNTGRVLSEETRNKMSESQKGRKLSEEHKRNLSKACVGRKLSEEAKKKVSEFQKGRKKSEATILKMKEARNRYLEKNKSTT